MFALKWVNEELAFAALNGCRDYLVKHSNNLKWILDAFFKHHYGYERISMNPRYYITNRKTKKRKEQNHISIWIGSCKVCSNLSNDDDTKHYAESL